MKLIGRATETALIAALLKAGKHVLLEGPVGSGKTSLALFVAEKFSKDGVVRVDGDGRFTEQKLVGSFDPNLVMDRGFSKKSFLPGPLYQAMSEGKILLINELNRMPEMVQNVLLPATDQGADGAQIHVPNLGNLKAKDGFRVIATQNPREFVGTAPLSEALLDRLEWVSINYLSEEQETEVLRLSAPKLSQELLEASVKLVRLTREFPKIKRGASIRAAISLAEVLETIKNPDQQKFWEIAVSVLANRIELQTSKFSAQAYAQSLKEVMADLQTQLEIALKKKP